MTILEGTKLAKLRGILIDQMGVGEVFTGGWCQVGVEECRWGLCCRCLVKQEVWVDLK